MSKTVDPRDSRWPRDMWLDAIWESEALRPNERVVAHAFARYAGKSRQTWCTWKELHRRTGIKSRDGINRAVKGLLDGGWLKETERARQHYSPRYELVVPTGQGSGKQTSETCGQLAQQSGKQTPETPSSPLDVLPSSPSPDTSSPFGDTSSLFGVPDISNRSLEHRGQTGGPRCPPEPPLREDDPSGRPNDQGNSPAVVVTEQTDLATQPTTRARRENIVPIFSRQKPENRSCGNCGTWLEPDGSCFNCRGRKAT